MNKIIAAAVFILLILSGMAHLARAAGTLDIAFQTTPLFSEINVIPGDTVSKTITVTNTTDSAQPIAFKVINAVDTAHIASAFLVKITEGSTIRYSGTMDDFFSPSERLLSTVSVGGTTTYTVTVHFTEEANNDFQNKSLGFDLVVGNQESSSSSGGGGGGGGSGGGGIIPNSQPEDQITVTNITQTSAIVHWSTNFFCTSQIVYRAPGESYSFNTGAANYGYPHATILNTTLVTGHDVPVTGLTPNTLYTFRVVCTTPSSLTISFEHTFTTLPGLTTPGGNNIGNGNNENQSSNNPAGSSQSDAGNNGVVLGLNTSPGITGTQQQGSNVASPEPSGEVLATETERKDNTTTPVAKGICNLLVWWPILYLLYALIMGLLGWYGRGKQAWWIAIAAIIVAILGFLVWWFEPCRPHYWWWLIYILVGVGEYMFLKYAFRKKEIEEQLPDILE